jgi:hypothetical protein
MTSTMAQVRLPPIERSGSVLRREAIELGLSHDEIERLLHAGIWVRVRYGAYAPGDAWARMAPEERHVVTAKAAQRSMTGVAVLGHTSAALLHGLPVWGVDLNEIHLVRGARHRGSRHESGVVHHAAALPDEHLVEVDGVLATTPLRTLADIGRTVGFESAVVTMDAALHEGMTSRDELIDLLVAQNDWPGSRAGLRAARFADGLSESVGESRGRVRFRDAGLPIPELQAEIFNELGEFVARSDWLFREHRTIGEFDGRLKMRLARQGGRSPEDVLWEEKLREDALRSLGYEIVRLTWDDLERAPVWFRRKILAAFARAHGRPQPIGMARAR